MKNKLNTSLLLISLLILFSLTVSAQMKRFKWAEGICEFEGTYNSKKVTEKQLKDTTNLMLSIGSLSLYYDATPAKYNDVNKLSLSQLESEYKAKLNELRSLELVDDYIWEELRQNKIRQVDQLYLLIKATIKGYKNSSALKKFEPAKTCADFYAPSLAEGGEYLLTTWKKVNMDKRLDNADPKRLERVFNQQYASPDKFKYAQLEVMTFGWWNCANSMRYIVKNDEKYMENFNKLFTNVKRICDEP